MSRSHRPRRLQPRARCERYMSECVDMCSIDVKTFLPLGHVRFLTFFNLKKNVGKVQSGKQISKKHVIQSLECKRP